MAPSKYNPTGRAFFKRAMPPKEGRLTGKKPKNFVQGPTFLRKRFFEANLNHLDTAGADHPQACARKFLGPSKTRHPHSFGSYALRMGEVGKPGRTKPAVADFQCYTTATALRYLWIVHAKVVRSWQFAATKGGEFVLKAKFPMVNRQP